MDTCDLAIIGAGPAGMAAAVAAAKLKLNAVVIDEQCAPGGQIYRSIEALGEDGRAQSIFGEDYIAGLALAKEFRASAVRYMPLTQVWQVDRERTVWLRNSSGVCGVKARQVLLATGAMERPVPVPGWTLPGVMTCGAAQTLLKGAGLAPDGKVALAGSGPLLLLLAVQLVRAGIRPRAVLETPTHLRKALAHVPSFVAAPGYLRKGLALLNELRRAAVPLVRGVHDLRILGETRAQGVQYRRGQREERIEADLILLHQGVVPNTNLAFSMRCEHEWSDVQRAFRPRKNRLFESSVEGVLIAGDCGGIAGAKAAELSGQLVALSAARALGNITAEEHERQSANIESTFQRHLAARPFLDTYYRPQQDILAPRDNETTVCRCEEIRAGDIRRLVREQGCPGPNQMKAFTRSGMGPCQGRLCGLTVVELIAECRGLSPSQIGYYRIRPPIKPVTVSDLATNA